MVDLSYRPAPEADEWLLHVRLGRDCAESTTEAYARSLGLFLDWCAATGLEWRQAPGHFGRFVYSVQRYDPGVPAVAQVRVVRGPRRVNAVLAAVREFSRHAAATGLADKSVLDALFGLVRITTFPPTCAGSGRGCGRGAGPGTGCRSRGASSATSATRRSCRCRVRAATDLQDWAKDRVAPREEEISQLRGLIRRIEGDVTGLTEDDQAPVAEAVTVIRETRQLVNLGMPAVRPAAETG